MDKKLKKIRKELVQLEARLESLEKEKIELQRKLDNLKAERSGVITAKVFCNKDEGSVRSELKKIRMQFVETQEALEETNEILAVLRARRDELKQEANELEAKIVEDVRKRFKAQLENRFEALAKEFEALWPIAQAGNPHSRPEFFAREISRLALRCAIRVGERAGDNLLKQEVTKMT